MKNCVVLDTGSYTLKAGFAKNLKPQHQIPCLVGNPRTTLRSAVIYRNPNESYVGHSAFLHRGMLRLRRPIEHGRVENWDDLESIWLDAYQNEMDIDPASYPVLLTETPLNPKQSKEKMFEIVMEKLGAPEALIENTGKLAVLSQNRFTGIALDIGDTVTTAVPVYKGMTLHHGIQRNEELLDRMHKRINDMLDSKNHFFRESAAGNISRHIKETCLTVPRQETTSSSHPNYEDIIYLMPDGTEIVITKREAQRCTKHLFDLGVGPEVCGLDQMVMNSVLKCDSRIWNALKSNIVVSGGTSLLPGLVDRLTINLSERDPMFKVNTSNHPQNLAWIGGATLCQIKPPVMWITKQIYQEDGPRIVHRYCF